MSALWEADHDGGEGNLEGVPWTFRDIPIMRCFEVGQLRGNERLVALKFRQFAEFVATYIPAGAEKTVALRKLLEAKDAAQRSVTIPGA